MNILYRLTKNIQSIIFQKNKKQEKTQQCYKTANKKITQVYIIIVTRHVFLSDFVLNKNQHIKQTLARKKVKLQVLKKERTGVCERA